MKKILTLVLAAMLVASMAACGSAPSSAPASTPASAAAPAAAKKELTGVGEGFGGPLKVSVTLEGDKITAVTVTENAETAGIGGPALTAIPEAIVKANKADVDAVSGATVTSKAIIYAVKNAMDPAANPAPVAKKEEAKPTETVSTAKAFMGTGVNFSTRMGPGKDDTETPVYSTNQVFVNAIFDDAGKILHLNIDQLEVATPNYDGDGMPHFSGFPGQGGYNFDDNHDGKIDGKKTDGTVDTFKSEIAGWQTKRQRGDSYKMGTGTWSAQMNAFEKQFVGMTIAEVEQWFAKYCSDLNGRPLKITEKSKDEDKAKFDKLTDAEKANLAELTSTATMSLNDAHGNIIAAMKDAFAKKVPLEISAASAQGFGLVNTIREGPGKDDTETPVYSFNQVFVNTLFDKDGKIAAINIDQLEVATPNYDGDGMPHFSGFPGQGGYNYDDNHDGKIDGKKTGGTEDEFVAEVAGWKTKRERGDSYKMGTGTWSAQMDTFQKLFVGKTPEEIKTWYAKYCSDLNGRPLKITDKSKDEDKAKFDKLTDAEKADLAEITSTATMSLNDSHGDILSAIVKSLDNKVAINLTIG